MKYLSLIFSWLFFAWGGIAQSSWNWTEIAPLPMSTANNAVCEAFINKQKFVYSFGGISDSLHISNIHQKVFKYDVSNNNWKEVSKTPDSIAKTGSTASFINNKIYLIGGKSILADSTEIISDVVHVYNPFLDTFEVDAASLLNPVCDHVQSIWRDSLIFIIAGENNQENVSGVQIFNPSFNSWVYGTAFPNEAEFGGFGASGYILGDTIYYYGGIGLDSSFQTINYLRKGVIDPENPAHISWSLVEPAPKNAVFRAACSGHNNSVFWIGGAKEAYNYNALGYNTNEPVKPSQQIIELSKTKSFSYSYYNAPYEIMDLKGIAKLGGGNWIIAGGIDSIYQASNRAFLLHNPHLSDIEKAKQPPYFQVREVNDYYVVVTENIGKIIVYNVLGKILYSSAKQLADLPILKSQLDEGFLLFVYEDGINLPVFLKKVNTQ